MKKIVHITEGDLQRIVCKLTEEVIYKAGKSIVKEDLTRGQVDDQIEDYVNGRDFEKRVNNIVVDVIGDFLESMWTKKSFWKTMLKKR